VVPTLAKNARMGQPQVVVIHGTEAQGWASPHFAYATAHKIRLTFALAFIRIHSVTVTN
jgi:hypothetical protein